MLLYKYNVRLDEMIVVQISSVRGLRDKRPQIFIVLIHFHLSEAWSRGLEENIDTLESRRYCLGGPGTSWTAVQYILNIIFK